MVAAQQKSFEAEQSHCNALRECPRIRQRSGPSQDPDDKMLAVNAEPRHKEYEPRKRLGRHTVHRTHKREKKSFTQLQMVQQNCQEETTDSEYPLEGGDKP